MASTTPSEKRTTTPPGSDRAEKRPKLTMAEIKRGPVFMLYRNYLKNKVDAVDEDLTNFTNLCMRYNWIPTMDQVNFMIEQANLIDEKHRLEFPVYPFMQEFKFLLYVAPDTNQPRMLVGKIPFSLGKQEVWAGWSKSTDNKNAAKLMLYYLPCPDGDDAGAFDLEPYNRNWIKWEEPFETLFQMSRILDLDSLDSSVDVQNAIMMSVAKVVIRFPGLMRPFDEHIDSLAAQLHRATFSSRPFDEFEPMSTESAYWDAYDLINSGLVFSEREHRCHPPDSDKFTLTAKRSRGRQSSRMVNPEDDDDDQN
ncbi:hypothetical protein KCU98_g1678, partial [Aureobasidium melanogenum]